MYCQNRKMRIDKKGLQNYDQKKEELSFPAVNIPENCWATTSNRSFIVVDGLKQHGEQ